MPHINRYIQKFSKQHSISSKAKIYALLIVLIITLYLPITPEIHLGTLGLLMIGLFFFSVWRSCISYMGLIMLGLLKDYLSHQYIGISSIEFVLMLSVGSMLRKATSNNSTQITLVLFAISIFAVCIFHEILMSLLHKQVVINKQYWKLVALYPILLYVPIHLFLSKWEMSEF